MSIFTSLMRSLVLACVALPALAFAADKAEKPHPITIDDLMALKYVSNPRISPDGAWIAYTVRVNDQEKDKRKTGIWMTSRDGTETLRLTGEDYSASSPRWSPDGRYLAFKAKIGKDAETQVWVQDRRGGDARQFTDVAQGVGGFHWSPDGSRMLLVITDQTEAEKARAEEETKEEEKPLPIVIDRLQFKQDYVGYLDRTRPHFYVFAEGDEAPRQITFGDYDDKSPVWSPDGTSIAFVSNRTEEPDNNFNTDIWTVEVDAKKPAKTLRQITTNAGADYAPAWSPDGKTLAFVTVLAPEKIWYAVQHLATVPATGGTPTVLNQGLDRNVSRPFYSVDGAGIYFTLEDSAEEQLARLDLASGQLDRLISGDLSANNFHQQQDGSIVGLVAKLTHPREVFLYADGDLAQVTRVNASVLDSVTLGEVRNITYQSEEGVEIEGFLYTPPNYKKGRKYPTLLRIHGGPAGQYDFTFSEEANLFAAHGYAVVLTNPRGSTGYGEDFSNALFADWGGPDTKDVIAGVDHAIELGIADPDRLGVGGWSYGGILTNYVITQSTRFEGAITGASEALYISNYGHDLYQRYWEMELGLPWENRELWERMSPFNQVDKVTTPTLLMGGQIDWNVPIINSEQLYQALKRLGIETELVVYPGEYHGFRRPSFIRDRYERYLDWYDRYVKDAK